MRVLFRCAFFSSSLLRGPVHSTSVLQIVASNKVSISFQNRVDQRPGREADQLTSHLHLLSRLRTSGAITLLPLFAFVACSGTFACTASHLESWKSLEESRCFVQANVNLNLTAWKEGKVPVHGIKACGKWRYSSAFATWAVVEVGWSAFTPGRFTLGWWTPVRIE